MKKVVVALSAAVLFFVAQGAARAQNPAAVQQRQQQIAFQQQQQRAWQVQQYQALQYQAWQRQQTLQYQAWQQRMIASQRNQGITCGQGNPNVFIEWADMMNAGNRMGGPVGAAVDVFGVAVAPIALVGGFLQFLDGIGR